MYNSEEQLKKYIVESLKKIVEDVESGKRVIADLNVECSVWVSKRDTSLFNKKEPGPTQRWNFILQDPTWSPSSKDGFFEAEHVIFDRELAVKENGPKLSKVFDHVLEQEE